MSRANIKFYPSSNAPLTNKVMTVLCCCAQGNPRKQTAVQLNRAEPTVRTQLDTARDYYNAPNAVNAVAIAVALGHIKFKFETNNSTTLRIGALTFALLACIVSFQDTPFVLDDIDNTLVRHTRTHRSKNNRSHKYGKRNKRDNAFIIENENNHTA